MLHSRTNRRRARPLFAVLLAIAMVGAIAGASVRRARRGRRSRAGVADQPAVLVEPLDHVPVDLELAEDYGGKVNPAGAESETVWGLSSVRNRGAQV
jgi:hypothetical protein